MSASSKTVTGWHEEVTRSELQIPANTRKHPLTEEDLHALLSKFKTGEYEDELFLAILLTGFHRLMRLGELTQPDARSKRLFLKLTMHHSLNIAPDKYSFHLPYHKGDQFFEGNTILIEARPGSLVCPHKLLSTYVTARDIRFPLYPELWLTSAGEVPTYSWFVTHLQRVLGAEVAGHSLRSGGATALALAGVCDNLIQAIGRWASDTFRIYICKHPNPPPGPHSRQTGFLPYHLIPNFPLDIHHLPTPPLFHHFLGSYGSASV